ncbi:MAG TPA: pyridoxal phosphate-dependent aminotransferase [Vicinamibacterales bacterium]
MFSDRIPSDLRHNRLAETLADLKRTSEPILDLTASNPTRAGFSYARDLLTPLADPRGLVYRPEPLGLREARQAVAADFARRKLAVAEEQIALTASTSEAYSLLFKLLCGPGDEILIPRPSYPLFDHLSRLDAVRAVPYDLEYHARWSVDVSSVERAFTGKTRAVLLVSPNNPTGQFVDRAEMAAIAALCRQHDAAIISDEVFADYDLASAGAPSGLLLERTDLVGFTLGGLSKSIGLPQAKLAWIVMSGPADSVADAQARLELASDTYLSVSTPIQLAAAELLERGADVRQQIQIRVRDNYRTLHARAGEVPSCELLHAEGGWYGVLRVPSIVSEEDLVVTLLAEDHVLVHPGYFFDFPRESFLVVSLLPPAEQFSDGVSRILSRFDHVSDRL